MTKKEFDRLAHEIAAESTWADIVSNCMPVAVRPGDGREWYITRDSATGAEEYVARAVRYLDAAGLLEHHVATPAIVRLKPEARDGR